MKMTVAMLSWGQHKTLTNTLSSYLNRGFLERPDTEYIIWFQEISQLDRDIAKFFGFKVYGSDTNIGIAEAYKELVNLANGDLFMFLENDWELISPSYKEIRSGQIALLTEEFDVVRYRSRTRPGAPLWTRQFEGKELSRPEHLLDSVHWISDPHLEFPQVIFHSDPFWYTTAQYANWTNNPTMFRKSFLVEHIVPRMGNRDLEKDIQPWWQQQNFWVAQGEGLFTHNRIG